MKRTYKFWYFKLGFLLLIAVLLVPSLFMFGSSHSGHAAGTFRNPINGGGDPWMQYFNGNYYVTTTQGNAIRMWKAPTIDGLYNAPAVTVWTDNNPSRCCDIWAPEFHFFNGRWYLYYTADNGSDITHRIYILESTGNDPLGPYSFKAKIYDPQHDNWAIDPTVFQDKHGRFYLLWSGDNNILFIAPMSNPWTIIGSRVFIPASAFGCNPAVHEAPEILQRNGRVFLIYSACDTGTPDYKLGELTANENANFLDPNAWIQNPNPVFTRNDANGVFGPGHNGFFTSPDGSEDWLVYHGKTTNAYTYDGRTTRVQKFNWNSDGTPNFGVPLALGTNISYPSSNGSSPGPLAFWKFDEGSGSSAYDSSIFQHTGIVNGASWTGGPVNSNGALNFNGVNSTIDIQQTLLDTSGSYTVAAWVKLSSTSSWSTILSQDGGNVSGFFLQYTSPTAGPDASKFALSLLSSDATTAPVSRAISNFSPQIGVWYHLTGVHDSSNNQIRLYVNGLLNSTRATPPAWRAHGETVIGRGDFGSTPVDYFHGSIDDVRIYNRILSNTEIQALGNSSN